MQEHDPYLKLRQPWLGEGNYDVLTNVETGPAADHNPLPSFGDYSPVAEAEQITSEAAAGAAVGPVHETAGFASQPEIVAMGGAAVSATVAFGEQVAGDGGYGAAGAGGGVGAGGGEGSGAGGGGEGGE